jgi:hypothetical protein
MKAFVGLPPTAARLAILHDCLLELQRVGLVSKITSTTNTRGHPPAGSASDGHDLTLGLPTSSSSSSRGGCYEGPENSNGNHFRAEDLMNEDNLNESKEKMLRDRHSKIDDDAHMAMVGERGVRERDEVEIAAGAVLRRAAVAAADLSGRTLRKLPFLAHAAYLQHGACTSLDFANALLLAIYDEHRERHALKDHSAPGL